MIRVVFAALLFVALGPLLAPTASRAEPSAGGTAATRGGDDGTDPTLTSEQVEMLLEWSPASYERLKQLLVDAKPLLPSDAFDRIRKGVLDVFPEVEQIRRNEMLMRFALNRSFMLLDVIKQPEVDATSTTLDARLRLLKRSVKLTTDYYEGDLLLLTSLSLGEVPAPIPFLEFGLVHADMVLDWSRGLLDASMRYEVSLIAIDWLKKDLARDRRFKDLFADETLRLNELSASLPSTAPSSDEECVKHLGRIRKLYSQIVPSIYNALSLVDRQAFNDSFRFKYDPDFRRTQALAKEEKQ